MVGVNMETLWVWTGGRKKSKVNSLRQRSQLMNSSCSRRNSKGEKETFKLKMGYEGDDLIDAEDTLERERSIALSRATHLHLEGKGITHIEDFGVCPEARVLFLQHNHLTRLANLRPLSQLKELYLQDNHITRLEGLRELTNLRRLLIPGNRIGVVEGLPQGLEELHIQNQRLPPGDSLVLDPHALTAVQTTLKLLDISGNRLIEMGAVGLLNSLRVLRAENNDLDVLSHVTAVVIRLSQLQDLFLFGNPVTAHRRYHPSLVLASPPTLETLDGREITPQSRDFVVQAECHRLSMRKVSKNKKSNDVSTSSQIFTRERHLLFTSATQIGPMDPPATGPSFVLGALRRPEFNLILNRAQRQSMDAYLAAREQKLDEEKLTLDEDHIHLEGQSENPNDLAQCDGHIGPDGEHNVHGDGDAQSKSVRTSSAVAVDFPLEKSVWFAGDEEPPVEEVPRFIPRPYWRNKAPSARASFTPNR